MPNSILIVLTGSLGDIARALCLPAHFKRHWPETRITWLVEARWKELLSNHPYIDRIVVFERTWRIGAVRNALRQLRTDSYDIALDLQRILKSGLMSKASGARRRIGFHPRNAKELNWVFNSEHIGFFSDHLSKLQHYLKFAEHLGLPAPSSLDFGLAQRRPAAENANRELDNHDFIAVVAGSSNASKDWHFAGYRELITSILAIGRHGVVLLGDQSQSAIASRLTEHFKSEQVINMVARTSLQELVTVLLQAQAAVGPDTGAGHLAAAVKTPYVTLMGPTAPHRVAPYGCEHLVVCGDTPCAPCGEKKCPQPQYDCMGAIGADAVLDKLEIALSQVNSKRE